MYFFWQSVTGHDSTTCGKGLRFTGMSLVSAFAVTQLLNRLPPEAVENALQVVEIDSQVGEFDLQVGEKFPQPAGVKSCISNSLNKTFAWRSEAKVCATRQAEQAISFVACL